MLSESISFSLSPMAAIWMAGPPSPFPTSCSLQFSKTHYTPRAERTTLQSPVLGLNSEQRSITLLSQSYDSDKINYGQLPYRGVAGLGLGFPVPLDTTIVSKRPDFRPSTAPAPTTSEYQISSSWPVKDILLACLESACDLLPPFELQPREFHSSICTPSWHIEHPNFRPTYTLTQEPVLEQDPDCPRRALSRPSPRRVKSLASDPELSPILEYGRWEESGRLVQPCTYPRLPPPPASSPETPRWELGCLYAKIRGKEDRPCSNFSARKPVIPKFAWLRGPVWAMPYTALPPTPSLLSTGTAEPCNENHHLQHNRFKSEQERKKLLRVQIRPAHDRSRTMSQKEERERVEKLTRLKKWEEWCAFKERHNRKSIWKKTKELSWAKVERWILSGSTISYYTYEKDI
ncbi:hypothetical protein B0H10DRAFT_2195161 [Mycena sp. CBHHK59/15]|nr:hypothetical protein B0H10DRAFT_2195161 [Mycena sp. CBHHK59/15]